MNITRIGYTLSGITAGTALVAGIALTDLTDGATSLGECRTFGGGYVACAPMFGPAGEKPTMAVQEDGSRGYEGGVVYDPETGKFRSSGH